jgi:hypothetical protein
MRVIGYAADSGRGALRVAGADPLLDSLDRLPGALSLG